MQSYIQIYIQCNDEKALDQNYPKLQEAYQVMINTY